MTEQEWEEIRKQRQIDQERDACRAEEARKAEKPAAPEREPVNPCWYVLACWQVVGLFVSIFSFHYLFISTIIRLCLIFTRLEGKMATITFWQLYLIGGFVVSVVQLHFFPLFSGFSFFLPAAQKFLIHTDVLLFWLSALIN